MVRVTVVPATTSPGREGVVTATPVTPPTVAACPLKSACDCVEALFQDCAISVGVTPPSAAASAMPSSLSLRLCASVKSNAIPSANVSGIRHMAVISAMLPARSDHSRRRAGRSPTGFFRSRIAPVTLCKGSRKMTSAA